MQGLGGQGPHPPPQPAHPAGSTRVTPPENTDEATSTSGDGSAKKGEPPFRACLLCRDAHTACDGQRPCRRCARLGKELQCRDAPTRKRGRRPQPPLATDLPVLLPQPPGGHGAAAAAAAKPLPLLRHLPTVVAAAAATQPLALPPHLLQPPTQAGNPALSHHHRPPQPQPQPTMPRGVAPVTQQPQAMPPSRHHNYHQPQPLPPPSLPPQQQQQQAPPSVPPTTQPPPRGAGDTSTTLTHPTTANVSPSRATAQADVACSAARWDDGRGPHARHRGGHHLNPRYDGDNGDGDEGAERRQRKRMKTTDEHEGKGKGESEDDGEGEGVKNEDEKNEKNEDEMNESEGEGDGNAPVTRRMMREMEKKLGLLAQLVEMMSGEMRSLRSESHRLRGAVKKMKGHRKQSDQLLAQLTMAQKQQQLHQQHHHQLHLQQNHQHQQQQQQQLTEQQQYSNQQWVNHLHQSPWIVDPPGHQRAAQEGFGDRGSLLLAPYSPAHGWASSSLSSSSSLYSSASSSSSSPTSSSSSSPASPPGSHRSLRSSFSFELSVLHAGVSPALLLEAREALPFLCDYDISPNRFAILDLRYPIVVSINPLSDTPPIMVYVNDAFTSLVGYAREELIGLPYTNIGSYNTSHRPQVPEFMRKPPMTSGDVFSFSPLVRCKDGRLLRLADRSQFFYDHYGDPHCAILCATSWHEDTMKESERFNKWLPLRQLAYHSAEPHLGDDDEANGASSG